MKNKLNWQKWRTILTGLGILIASGWGIFIYLLPSEEHYALPEKTVNIDDSKGIIFTDMIIRGGASILESEEVEFNKTRITE